MTDDELITSLRQALEEADRDAIEASRRAARYARALAALENDDGPLTIRVAPGRIVTPAELVADVEATIAKYEQCRCGRFSSVIGSDYFPHIDGDDIVHSTLTDCHQAAPAPAPSIAEPARSRPPADVDHAEVARLARDARAAGQNGAQAVAAHYDITAGAARQRILKAARKGHDTGTVGPLVDVADVPADGDVIGTLHGVPVVIDSQAPAGGLPVSIEDAGSATADETEHAPRPVTAAEWLGRVDADDDTGTYGHVDEPAIAVPDLDEPANQTGFPVLVIDDPHEDEPAVDDPPLSTHAPTCDCIRCATRRHRAARDAATAKAAADAAARLEWGPNGKLPRQRVRDT